MLQWVESRASSNAQPAALVWFSITFLCDLQRMASMIRCQWWSNNNIIQRKAKWLSEKINYPPRSQELKRDHATNCWPFLRIKVKGIGPLIATMNKSACLCGHQKQCLILIQSLSRFLLLPSCIEIHIPSLVLKTPAQRKLLRAEEQALDWIATILLLDLVFEFLRGVLVDQNYMSAMILSIPSVISLLNSFFAVVCHSSRVMAQCKGGQISWNKISWEQIFHSQR